MRFFVEVLLCAAGREGRVGAKGRNRDCECSFFFRCHFAQQIEEVELEQKEGTETANAVFFQVPLRAADRGGRVGAKGRNRDCECSFFQVPLRAADRGGRVGAKGRNRDCECSFCSHPNPRSLEVAIEMCSLNNRYMCMGKILCFQGITE